MTTIADIEALGIEVPKGREYEHLTDVECWPTTHIDEAAGAALTEAYSVIERLVGERDELLLEAYHYGGFGGLYSAEYEDWLKELRQRIDLARYQHESEHQGEPTPTSSEWAADQWRQMTAPRYQPGGES